MPLPASDYIPLPHPGQDSSSHPTSGGSIHTSKKPTPSSNLKRNFLFRISAFCILELGFIALAFISGWKPVVLNLPSSTTLSEAKGGFTVISILWHALAAFTVKEILMHIFSAEWMEQYHTSGDLVPGETDNVSRITSGYVEQIKHFISNKATVPFRMGFISTLLLVFLNALGPSTISVSSITLHRPLIAQVANLTKTKPIIEDLSPWEGERANLITRLEYLEGTEYGFTVDGSNVLIPWPSPDPPSTHRVVTYETDVATYNFSCSWKLPTIKLKENSGDLIVDNLHWLPSRDADAAGSAISPLLNGGEDTNSSLSAFFFVGGNSTINRGSLDLGDIPTLFIPPGERVQFTDTPSPRLISVLICDPQIRLAPATVTISDGSRLRAVPRSGPPVVKNIPVEAANLLFSESLITATSDTSFANAAIGNPIAQILFLPDASVDDGDKPLSLDKINQNMNKMLMSSAKAYLSGYRLEGTAFASPSFEMINTTATAETQALALTTSRPFLIALLVVCCILVVFLSFIVLGGRVNDLQTFDLENIVKILEIGR